MPNKINVKYSIAAYLLFLTAVCGFMQPSHDIIYYYYPWSLHLQLSYYDGPPLIAYILRLITTVFGHNTFALNFFMVIIAGFSCYVVSKIGELLINRQFGYCIAYLWLVYPFSTTRFIFITANYDCLDNLFGLLTLFTLLKFLQCNDKKYSAKNKLFLLCTIRGKKQIQDFSPAGRWLYVAGVTAGLLLLSKYTGIIAIIAMIIYLLYNQSTRYVFKSWHIYLSGLLCLIIFSPVLIWNYQQHFVSFNYQLTTHLWSAQQFNQSQGHNKYGLAGVWFYLCSDILGVVHILLILLLVAYYKSRQLTHDGQVVVNALTLQQQLKLLWTVIIVYAIFWLVISYFAHVAMNYLLFPESVLLILTAYYLQKYNLQKLLLILMILFTVISIVMMINRATHTYSTAYENLVI